MKVKESKTKMVPTLPTLLRMTTQLALLSPLALVVGFTPSTTYNEQRLQSLDYADPEFIEFPCLPPLSKSPKLAGPWTQRYPFAEKLASTYNAMPEEACSSFPCKDVEGSIPADLEGSYLKIGPGNLERAGQRYKHFLDGDGFVTKIDFARGQATYAGNFVETEYFQAESKQDKILYRNIFGTQREGGAFKNAFDVEFKNPANTNILKWGGKLFAFWEGGRPYELDPDTLETLEHTVNDGPFQALGDPFLLVRRTLIDEGGPLDRSCKLGRWFTGHPLVTDNGKTLVGCRGARNVITNELKLEFPEFDQDWTEITSTSMAVPNGMPSHDFMVGGDFIGFFQNGLELDSVSCLLGMTDFVALNLNKPCVLHLVPRGEMSESSTKKTIQAALPQGYFNVHCVGLEQDGDKLTVYSNGWDLEDHRYFPAEKQSFPFLGRWGGHHPSYDCSGGCGVPPSLLYKTVIDLTTEEVWLFMECWQ